MQAFVFSYSSAAGQRPASLLAGRPVNPRAGPAISLPSPTLCVLGLLCDVRQAPSEREWVWGTTHVCCRSAHFSIGHRSSDGLSSGRAGQVRRPGRPPPRDARKTRRSLILNEHVLTTSCAWALCWGLGTWGLTLPSQQDHQIKNFHCIDEKPACGPAYLS